MILHVTEACGGGVRRHLQLLVPELMRRGLDCGIFAFGNRMEPGFREDLASMMQRGCKVAMVRGTAMAAWTVFRRVLREWSPRLLHSHAARGGLLARLCCGDIPVLHSPHGLPIPGTLRHRLIYGMERLVGSRTAAYILVSPAEQESMFSLGISPKKCHIVCNGVPPELASQACTAETARRTLGLPAEGKLIGVPARLVAQKGLDTMLRALPAIHPDCRLVLCGEGPERDRLVKLADTLGVQSRVVFAGHVEGLWRLLRAFDAIALPSRYEGLSYALLEAIALECPLIASDIPANVPNPELRPHLHLFPPDNAEALALAVNDLLSHPDQSRAHASQAKLLLDRDFSLETQAESLVQLYAKWLVTSS